MKNPITERQKQLLTIIYEFIKNTGYPPSFNEMRENLGVSSNQSILDLLNKLVEARLVQRSASAARGISILPAGYEILNRPSLVGFVGMTSAGVPMEAIEISGEWEVVSKDAAKLKNEVFLLKVIGDSMINAGIDDGDVVLVQSQKEFSSGDIVLANISDEATIKRFISEDKPPFIYLKPENPNYDVTPFTEETRLSGKVISVLKNGYWKSLS